MLPEYLYGQCARCGGSFTVTHNCQPEPLSEEAKSRIAELCDFVLQPTAPADGEGFAYFRWRSHLLASNWNGVVPYSNKCLRRWRKRQL